MQQYPITDFGSPNREGLRKFLGMCQAAAKTRNHPILASISLPSEFIDPLAVLQSVNDPSKHHFYFERHAHHLGVAGAEPVIECSTHGPSRFKKIQSFSQEWLDHCVFVGDTELPWSGPQFFSQFSFEDELQDPEFLAPGYAFVPRWMVAWQGNQFCATANLVVDEQANLDGLIEPLWRAHKRFASFEFNPEEEENLRPENHSSNTRIIGQSGSEQQYIDAVRDALQRIENGDLEKIVISRTLGLESDNAFVPLEALDLLRHRFPDCTTMSFQNQNGASFIGATPERLIEVRKGKFFTEALAGSMKRGRGAMQDASLTKQLLSSRKNRNEHGVVLKYIQERLVELGLTPEFAANPEILQLSNIQHLRVPVRGNAEEKHILELAEVLHPTPALGGFPKAKALDLIGELEPQTRGPYAGITGWFNAAGEGEFVVNIRSALVQGNCAKLYAGCGIVEGSDPHLELQETELKLISMLTCFINLDAAH